MSFVRRPSSLPVHAVGRALVVMILGLLAPSLGSTSEQTAPSSNPQLPAAARYHVTMRPGSLRLAVRASLPVSGRELRMGDSWPAGIPETDSLGWCGLVSGLEATDASGRRLELSVTGVNRWQFAQPVTGMIELRYEVDYERLRLRGWPAPREAASADSSHLALVGRSLFVTTPGAGAGEVAFMLPHGWRAVTAWSPKQGARATFRFAAPEELLENLCVLTRGATDDVAVGDFRLHVVAMGPWQSSRAEVRRVLEPVVRRFVAVMGVAHPVDYLVVLLPQADSGGESYRSSFALTVETPPSAATRTAWGKVIAHEIFHLWNGWQLHGEDYASTQWFQEGFTEYAAMSAMVRTGLMSPEEFLDQLSTHLQNYRRLTTTLEAIGGRKGPPLYGGGALTAFAWDVMIREATSGRRSLADFWGEFLRETQGGERAYAWPDVRAALTRVAPLDWEGYYQSHVRGAVPVPFETVLPSAGLRLQRAASGVERFASDSAAAPGARRLWLGLVAAE